MALCLVALLPCRSHAAQRGISIQMTTPYGETENVRLYSGYHALVIGVAAYEEGWPRLANPIKDTREVASLLEAQGFTVECIEDPNSFALRRAFNKLAIGPGKDEDKGILVWYSGHGYTNEEIDGTKLGYLVPVDAPLPEEDELGFMEKALNMRQLVTISRRMQAKHVMMVFDSCFSGSIFQLTRAKPTPFIESKVREPVRLFITSGDENEQVPDASLFKTLFLQGLDKRYADRNRDGYVTGMELGDYLQEHVVNYSLDSQHPQFGKINHPLLDKGDFVFALDDGRAGPLDTRFAPLLPEPPPPMRTVEKTSVAVLPLFVYGQVDPGRSTGHVRTSYKSDVLNLLMKVQDLEIHWGFDNPPDNVVPIADDLVQRFKVWESGSPHKDNLRRLSYELDVEYVLLSLYSPGVSTQPYKFSCYLYDVEAGELFNTHDTGKSRPSTKIRPLLESLVSKASWEMVASP